MYYILSLNLKMNLSPLYKYLHNRKTINLTTPNKNSLSLHSMKFAENISTLHINTRDF